MAKRIAFFIGQIMHSFQWEVIEGVSQAATEEGYRVEIFSNFGTYGDNYLHAEGEKNIINLPHLNEYDAIIVAADTFDIAGTPEELSEKLRKEAACPVVFLRCEDSDYYNILSDDEKAMEQMVEHLITEHGKKRICFMTGRMDLEDAHKRLRGYQNAMDKYGLMITDHMLFEGNYWRNKGQEAVKWFLSGGEYPEAIVCSNDFMAISVCDALMERGIRIPEDICVTGFDNIDEARCYNPSITGVAVRFDIMGRTAVQMLKNVFEGKPQERYEYVPAEINCGGSCGCASYEGTDLRQLYIEKEYLKTAILQTAYMNVDMENCNNLEELVQIAFKYSSPFQYKTMYLCLCERVHMEDEELSVNEEYTEEMAVKAILRHRKECVLCDEKFQRKEILPEKYRKTGNLIYCYPLHYKNQCMGYMVMETDSPRIIDRYFSTWLLTLSNYLDKVRVYSENQSLMYFRQQSLLDELTGLNNRRSYEGILRRKYTSARMTKEGFFVFSCDMDGLKMINDTYGHLEGDEALKAFADVLKKAERPGLYSARVGGDEFNMCYATQHKADVTQLLRDIEENIAEFNKSSNKPYRLSASIGYAFCSGKTPLVSCMQMADNNMYREKVNKKNSRSFQERQEKNV